MPPMDEARELLRQLAEAADGDLRARIAAVRDALEADERALRADAFADGLAMGYRIGASGLPRRDGRP